MDSNSLCMNCMQTKENGDGICPRCGFDPKKRIPKPNCLPSPSILKGRYLVGEPLGIGGFGITYIAYDMKVGAVCAVKEYMPDSVAARFGESVRITLNDQKRELFDYGLKRFIEESEMLAAFVGEPNIIHVLDHFEENHTAYTVMEYLDGCDLKRATRDFTKTLDPKIGLSMMLQVMNGLEALHRNQVIHRDISPDNIYITKDNWVKLLDFGSARYSFNQRNRNLSIILKVGYAPPEQYSSAIEQGAWTDIYALAATFYHVFTGVIPPESTERLLQDTMKPACELNAALPVSLSRVLMKALSLKVEDRYHSVREMREDLLNVSRRGEPAPPVKSSQGQPSRRLSQPPKAESTIRTSVSSASSILFMRRVAAYAIDCALYAFLMGAFIGLVWQFIQGQGMLAEVAGPVLTGTLLITPVVIVLLNALLESSSSGATIGKRITGLKTVDMNGGSLCTTQALKRNLCKLLSVFLLLTEVDRRYLHERISSSKVIDIKPK